ncbi:MAG: SHOCT domain-containing protein [Ruminococcus sp.]
MAFNDFLKKAKETATNAANSAKNAANSAKTKYDEKKKEMDTQKAEKERINAEKQAEADSAAKQMLDEMNANSGNLFGIDSKQLLDFTADFYDKLYLPAHSISASKIIFHPLDKKMEKYAQKDFPEYSSANETPVFMILGKNQQRILLSTKALYYKKAFDENNTFFCSGSIPIENIATLTYKKVDEDYIFTCNGVELLNSKYGFSLDVNSFEEYTTRLKNRDFVITNEQIDKLIKEKIGANILKIVNEYVYEDEIILYFAWGCDSITAKDFVVCTDKQMVVLDREAFGLTKNVKQFYYEDVTSMATIQNTNGLLDLALTVALSVCDLEISVAGAKERLSNLYTYEAEKAVKVYRECRRNIKEGGRQPQVVVQQTSAVQVDPLEQLQKLQKLKEAGIITEDEFNAKKAELLSKI